MYDDRHKCVALALAANGVTTALQNSIAGAVPFACWDRLHADGLVETARDVTGEGVTRTTRAGAEWLWERLRG